MIIKTEKSTYYVKELIDDTNEELVIFKGFKDIKKSNKISLRKIRLKKKHIKSLIDTKKIPILLKNNKGDFRRLNTIDELIELNKDKITFIPCSLREVIKFYNDVTRKFTELN